MDVFGGHSSPHATAPNNTGLDPPVSKPKFRKEAAFGYDFGVEPTPPTGRGLFSHGSVSPSAGSFELT